MKFFWVTILFVFFTACGINKQLTQDLQKLETSFQHHTGLALYDLEAGRVVYEKNASKYFTPASNTKILTFYTASHVIGDSIPAYYFVESEDSLVIWGSGDPSFLYKNLPASDVWNHLKNTDKGLYFSTTNFKDNHFGAGWAWDDYLYTFSSEKSAFPVYGNSLTIRKQQNTPYLNIDLPYFQAYFNMGDSIEKSHVTRAIGSNDILYEPAMIDEAFKREVPFKTNGIITANLLTDTLKKKVNHIKKQKPATFDTQYSIPADSAFKVMMQESDNFIAEQLLLVSAGLLSDSLYTKIAIDWAQDSLLKGSPDPIIWKDGSGLSRYNLITPRSVVWLWRQLYHQFGRERLFSLIAAGGESGTLKNYYNAPEPYIYGKTGTLSNNHNLSGFLVTQKGKLLIFSFMNNNYPTESRPVKHEMERILWQIHLNY